MLISLWLETRFQLQCSVSFKNISKNDKCQQHFLAIFGNLLTLVAIPYIQRKYGQEFSILQLNSVTLILHLSLCDLLYALIGFPHLIHSTLYKTTSFYSTNKELCSFLGVFRNIVAFTDFNNIALISCCLSRQILCRYILTYIFDDKYK